MENTNFSANAENIEVEEIDFGAFEMLDIDESELPFRFEDDTTTVSSSNISREDVPAEEKEDSTTESSDVSEETDTVTNSSEEDEKVSETDTISESETEVEEVEINLPLLLEKYKTEGSLMDNKNRLVLYVVEKAATSKEFYVLVMQEHKTMERAWAFINKKVQAILSENKGNSNFAFFSDDVVYHWVDDYFTFDDLAIIEEEARKKAEEEAKRAEAAAKKKPRKKATSKTSVKVTTSDKSEPEKAAEVVAVTPVSESSSEPKEWEVLEDEGQLTFVF